MTDFILALRNIAEKLNVYDPQTMDIMYSDDVDYRISKAFLQLAAQLETAEKPVSVQELSE